MNYLLQINAFWNLFEDEPDPDFSPQFRIVYLSLLKLNNGSGWKKKFTATFTEVNKLSGGIAKKTYYSSIEFLVERKLILYFPSKSKWQASFFTIVKIYNEKEVLTVSQETGRKPIKPLPVSDETHRKPVGNRYETDRGNIPKPIKLSKPIKHIKLSKGQSAPEVAVLPIIEKKKFIKPTIEELTEYVRDEKKMNPRDSGAFAERFFNFYESNGWKVGKNPMQKWKAAVGSWIAKGDIYGPVKGSQASLVTVYKAPMPKPPAAEPIPKEVQAKLTFTELIRIVRTKNEIPFPFPWGEIWFYLTLKGRTQRIHENRKQRIKDAVIKRLQDEAEAKARKSDPRQKTAILQAALTDLDYQCKRQFCIEYFNRYIKPPQNGTDK